jgi:peptide/nickel transport system substrate-binding protein
MVTGAGMRRRTRWLWPLLLIATLCGCGHPPDGALRMGLAAAPMNLDPRFATDAASARVNRLLYRRLVEFDASGMARPALANWQRLSPLHYRFALQDAGRRFHDDTRLTAADVKATYDSVLDPATGSPHRASLELIERIETDGQDRIDFYLRRPDPLFPAYLVIGILPAKLLARGHAFATDPVGSGPFRFLGWPSEGRLRLRRLRDGQVFELLEVKDPTVRVLKLLRGEIDMLQNDLPPELVTYLQREPGIQIQRSPGSNFSYLGFNLQDSDSKKLQVRRAVAYAVDRDAIIHYLLQGTARPAQALFPPEHWVSAPDLPPYPHDLPRARALLAQAGYGPDHPLRLVYKTSSDPFRIRLASVIQQQLARAGIEVELQSFDWGTFYRDIREGRFQMYSLAWVGLETPDIFRYVFHSGSLPPAGANRGRYADAETDRLIEQAESIPELADRIPVYRALQRRLLQQLPYVPLWYEEHLFVCRADIRGYRVAGDGNYDGLNDVERDLGKAHE